MNLPTLNVWPRPPTGCIRQWPPKLLPYDEDSRLAAHIAHCIAKRTPMGDLVSKDKRWKSAQDRTPPWPPSWPLTVPHGTRHETENE